MENQKKRRLPRSQPNHAGTIKGFQIRPKRCYGDLNIIKNFKYQTLRDYYHKWYRPDLQAIAVVGDFDVDQMEKKVKELFSKIPTR